MKKKGVILLRTDLDCNKISQSLREYTSHNTIEIVANLKKQKIPFKDKLLRRHTIAHTELIDFNKFDSISINVDSPNASINIQCLLEENYTFYIDKLRTLYPSFKFNHYSKYFEKLRLIKKDQKTNESEYKLYVQMEHIETLFQCKSNEYKIEPSIFEQKKEVLQLAVQSLDSQIEGIELELGKVLKRNAVIENFINNHLYLKTAIDNVLTNLISKRITKEYFKQHYLFNSSKLIISMSAKRNKANVLNLMKQVNNVIVLIYQIENNLNLLNSSNTNLSNIKYKMSRLRKINNLKLISYIEKEIQKYNDQSEIKHIEQFSQIITHTIYNCFKLSNTETSEIHSNSLNTQGNYVFGSIQKHDKNYINVSKNISFYFLLLLPNKTEILNQILNGFSIVISENYEIPIIIEKLKGIFSEIIIMLFINLKQMLSNIELISTLSKAYFVLIENYNYLLELFKVNFAFAPKNFIELSKFIKTETKNRLCPTVNSMIIELITNGDVEQLLFTKEKMKEILNDYFNDINISFEEYYSQYENDFIFQLFQIQIEKIKDCTNKETWVQMPKIKLYYQKIINILLIDFHEISKEELYSTLSISTLNEDINYLQIKGSNLIGMESTLILIEFLFSVYKLLYYLNYRYSQTIILQLCKWITYYLNKTQATIINSQGEVNNKKITEKEFMLVNATIVLLKHIFFSFITYFIGINDNEINETINAVLKKINEIHLSCIESMNEVSTQVINETIKEFNSLSFSEYPTFTEKNYNVYIIKYGKLKKIYDSMLLSFEVQDTILLYNKNFTELFEQMNKIVNSKPKIENEEMLKQYVTLFICLDFGVKCFI